MIVGLFLLIIFPQFKASYLLQDTYIDKLANRHQESYEKQNIIITLAMETEKRGGLSGLMQGISELFASRGHKVLFYYCNDKLILSNNVRKFISCKIIFFYLILNLIYYQIIPLNNHQ